MFGCTFSPLSRSRYAYLGARREEERITRETAEKFGLRPIDVYRIFLGWARTIRSIITLHITHSRDRSDMRNWEKEEENIICVSFAQDQSIVISEKLCARASATDIAPANLRCVIEQKSRLRGTFQHARRIDILYSLWPIVVAFLLVLYASLATIGKPFFI